jgi:hypothetical protein
MHFLNGVMDRLKSYDTSTKIYTYRSWSVLHQLNTLCTEQLETASERNAQQFALNFSNREQNAEHSAQNDSNGERFGLNFKICITETLAIYYSLH